MFPKIMGIINATPDSFSDGIGEINLDNLFFKSEKMIEEGVDIIDIGGESTKPGSNDVSVDVELDRVLPIIKLIKRKYDSISISVDTRKAEVVAESLKLGVDFINDVSGLQYNPEIAEIVAKYDKQLIIMHSKDTPKNMQDNPQYDDVVKEVYNFLKEKINIARNKGVNKIIVDVGIGFAKTIEHNLELLRNIDFFQKLGVSQLLGISRKKIIGEITDISVPQDRDFATMVLHSLLLHTNSVDIIRVHNVAMATQMRKIHKQLFI